MQTGVTPQRASPADRPKEGEGRTAAFRKKWRNSGVLLLMVSPCLLYYLLFKYLPIFGIVISFKNYNLYRGIWESHWVGWRYYQLFLQNPDFWPILRNTILLGAYKLLFGFPIPIAVALLMNELKHATFKRFVQTASYLPHFISNVVVASMVVLFLSPSSGLVNRFLVWTGSPAINFLVDPGWFRTIYVASDIWQHFGWETIIFLAALTAIDPVLYEAADIDGANRARKLFHVTLPGIMPAVMVVLILNIGKVLEIGFEKVYLLSNPATYETADIISTYVYRVGLVNTNFSYAAAIDLMTGVVSLIFLLSANYLSRKFSENSLW